jgi:deoxyribose-phosphate aldolase
VKPPELAALIDHTLLRPEASRSDIEALCAEAVSHGFATVCVNPIWVPVASSAVAGAGPGVCSVAGFPLGATRAKAREADLAVRSGATEIDMVIALGLVKGGDWAGVAADIREVVSASGGRPVKVILETCLLTREEKLTAVEVLACEGAAFAKTSTGFSAGGATVEDVALLHAASRNRLEIKASGGIADLDTALLLIAAGASRLGTSRSVEILRDSIERAASGVF